MLAALDRPPSAGKEPPARLYNLGNSRAENLLDFVGVLEKAVGKKAEMDLQPLQLGDVPETFADIETSKRDLGYEPKTSIAEGIPKFVEWYKGLPQRLKSTQYPQSPAHGRWVWVPSRVRRG